MLSALLRLAEVTTTTSNCTVNGQASNCSAAAAAAAGSFMLVFLFFYLPIIVLILASMWKLFTKAGKPGWASIVPIYNYYVQLQIIGRPTWWLLLLLVPFVNIVVSIIVIFDMAKAYGEGVGMGLLILFLPFVGYPILAFGKSKYVGPLADTEAAPGAGSQTTPPPPTTPPVAPPVAPTDAPTPPSAPTNPVQ